jgi:hypothetical protein
MRPNAILASLLLSCALLTVLQVATLWVQRLPVASGQAVGDAAGDVILATGMTASGNEAVVYIYHKASDTLSCYAVRNHGIEFRGMRKITWDRKFDEFNPQGKILTVADIKKLNP